MRNLYWFSMFMSWFFIRIIFFVTWTWLILFGRRIIWWIGMEIIVAICVIFMFMCFRLLNIFLNILSNSNIFRITFFVGVCFWNLLQRSCLPGGKTVLYIFCVNNSTFEWFSSTGNFRIIVVSIRQNKNWSMWMLHHG